MGLIDKLGDKAVEKITGNTTTLILYHIYHIPIWLCVLFMLIMFVDWFLQYKNICQSTNFRRLITGFLCGCGVLNLVILFFGGIIHG